MNEESDSPPVVYKYRNWTDVYHQNMLRLNQLYLSSPADFNDPFDCRIPVNYLLLDTEEKIREYINSYIAREHDHVVRDGMDINRLEGIMFDRLTNHGEELQNESETQEFKQIDDHYGVLSLSKRWNSILMWSHYADRHRGYCIGFHEEKLRNAKKFGRGGMVITNEQHDDYPEVDPRDEDVMRKALLQTHYKACEWDYEQEYRLTKLFGGAIPTIQDRQCEVTDDFIAEVIIGLRTPPVHKNEIIEIAVQKHIPVYQAVQVPLKFRIDREQIA